MRTRTEGAMSGKEKTTFEAFPTALDDDAWAATIQELLPSIHEVDRTATQIWFRFFPVALLRAFEQSEDPSRLAQELLMQGRWYLKDQTDTSHTFLYGHRFWPEVKRAVVRMAESELKTGATLTEAVREIARAVASERKVDESLTTGIAAVGLMTLEQVGLAEFRRTPGEVL